MVYDPGIPPFIAFFDADPAEDEKALWLQRRLSAGAQVLDLGAGTATLAFALASRGFSVTALEPDPHMAAVALTRLASRRDLDAHLTLLPWGSEGPELGEAFDAVVCLSVLHLLADRRQAWTFCARNLAPGGFGLFLAPVRSRQRMSRAWDVVARRRCGRVDYTHKSMLQDAGDDLWRTSWAFEAAIGGRCIQRVEQTFTWQAPPADVLAREAAQSGLALVERHAGFDDGPFEAGDSKVLVAIAHPVS